MCMREYSVARCIAVAKRVRWQDISYVVSKMHIAYITVSSRRLKFMNILGCSAVVFLIKSKDIGMYDRETYRKQQCQCNNAFYSHDYLKPSLNKRY